MEWFFAKASATKREKDIPNLETLQALVNEEVEQFVVADPSGGPLAGTTANTEGQSPFIDALDQVEWSAKDALAGQHLAEVMVPALLRLHDCPRFQLPVRTKYWPQLLRKSDKAKEIIFLLEQQMLPSANSETGTGGALGRRTWETKGLIAESLVRQIRVLPATRFRSRIVCNSLPHTFLLFKHASVSTTLKYLARPAFQLARNLVLTPDGRELQQEQGAHEDVLPETMATEAISTFVFALFEKIFMASCGEDKESRPVLSCFGKTLRGEADFPECPLVEDTGEGEQQHTAACEDVLQSSRTGETEAEMQLSTRQQMDYLCRAAACLSFSNRPSIAPRRTTQSGPEHEVSPLGLASFVYFAECSSLVWGRKNQSTTSVVTSAPSPETASSGTSKATTADSLQPLDPPPPSDKHGSVLSSARANIKNGSVEVDGKCGPYLPCVWSHATRYDYLRCATEALLVHRKFAAAFHLWDSLLRPLLKVVMCDTPPPSGHLSLLPPAFYLEFLKALATAVPEDHGEPKRKISAATTGAPLVLQEPALLQSADADVRDAQTRTVLYRDMEKALYEVSFRAAANVRQQSTSDKAPNSPMEAELVGLETRWDQYFRPVVQYCLKPSAHQQVLPPVLSSVKAEFWDCLAKMEITHKDLGTQGDEKLCTGTSCNSVDAEIARVERIKNNQQARLAAVFESVLRALLEGDDSFLGSDFSLVDASEVLTYALNLLRLWYSNRCRDFFVAIEVKSFDRFLNKIGQKIDLERTLAQADQSRLFPLERVAFLLNEVRELQKKIPGTA
ncbi:unnamed protein product [Amoebophrya sp. A120]|nr:unnamed protein product [Amoebophrya sp. A120]|eukprot:GSA120T00006591001.1